jgi:hypothetical protein
MTQPAGLGFFSAGCCSVEPQNILAPHVRRLYDFAVADTH